MSRLFRRLLGRKPSVGEKSVRYERRAVSVAKVRQRGWSRDLARVREVLPIHLHEAPLPAPASKAFWVVVAISGREAVGLAWAVPWVGEEQCVNIEEVAVMGERQGEGIGGSLVREIARWTQELGAQRAFIYPIGRSGWITRLGFVPVGGGTYSAPLARLA